MNITGTLLDRMDKENREMLESFNKDKYFAVYQLAMEALTTKRSWLDLTYQEGDCIATVSGKPGQTFANVFNMFDN
jgi:hypothetical protein